MRGQRGFTLIEVLLAITILSVVAGMLYRSLTLSGEMVQHVELSAEQYRSGRLVLTRMSDQLMSTWYQKDDATARFEGQRIFTADRWAADTLTFSSMSGIVPDEGPASYRVDLSHRMQDGILYMREEGELRRSLEFPVAEGLAGFQLEYLDRQSADGPGNWVPDWTAQNGPPEAVRVTLMFPAGADSEDLNEETELLTLASVIPVPVGGG